MSGESVTRHLQCLLHRGNLYSSKSLVLTPGPNPCNSSLWALNQLTADSGCGESEAGCAEQRALDRGRLQTDHAGSPARTLSPGSGLPGKTLPWMAVPLLCSAGLSIPLPGLLRVSPRFKYKAPRDNSLKLPHYNF